MGVLTDFVVADRADAQRVGEAQVPSREFPGIDAKGMDQVKMGTLYAILTGTEYDPDFLSTDDSFLYVGSDDGPWVQAIPEDMVRKLAALSPAERARVASEWAATEEFAPQYDDWPEEAVASVLEELCKLSETAVAEHKSLLLWTCL